MNNQNSKKQPWGPFIKQVLGPNVPWIWYIVNLVAQMAVLKVLMVGYRLTGPIMSGDA